MMTWKLQAITGEFTGQEIAIEQDMLVGRHQDAGLVLQAAEVSRKHAALLLQNDQLWVQDLKSSNGTFVNDVRIEGEVQLHDADIVQFASLKFAVLAPAKPQLEREALPEVELEPVHHSVEQPNVNAHQTQPVDAGMPTLTERDTGAEVSREGMPTLTERDTGAEVSREGMPQNVAVPKPAPIPDGVVVNATPDPKPVAIEQPVSSVEKEIEQRKNASVGFMTIVVLIILAVMAWVFLK